MSRTGREMTLRLVSSPVADVSHHTGLQGVDITAPPGRYGRCMCAATAKAERKPAYMWTCDTARRETLPVGAFHRCQRRCCTWSRANTPCNSVSFLELSSSPTGRGVGVRGRGLCAFPLTQPLSPSGGEELEQSQTAREKCGSMPRIRQAWRPSCQVMLTLAVVSLLSAGSCWPCAIVRVHATPRPAQAGAR